MYYTYVLQSLKDSNFYIGFTEDLKLRFEQHNKGMVESTRGRKPLKLIYYEACIDKQDALRREKYFKTYHGKMFLRRRLKSYLTGKEGFSRKGNREFVQYLFISKSSSAEVQSHLYVALDQGYIEKEIFEKIYQQAEKVSKMCSGFIKYLNSQPNKPKQTQ